MENVNKHFVADDRSDKEKYLEAWGYELGSIEGERAWKEKIEFQKQRAPMVMGDIQPYVSMIDGSLIESRSKHRTHLKDHNCIEIGNEVKHLTKNVKPLESPRGLKEQLIRAVDDNQRKKRRY